jgi:hypothetical protein
MRLRPRGGRNSSVVTGVVTRLTVTELAVVGWPLLETWQEISAAIGIPEQV